MAEWQINVDSCNNFYATIHEPLTVFSVALKDSSLNQMFAGSNIYILL